MSPDVSHVFQNFFEKPAAGRNFKTSFLYLGGTEVCAHPIRNTAGHGKPAKLPAPLLQKPVHFHRRLTDTLHSLRRKTADHLPQPCLSAVPFHKSADYLIRSGQAIGGNALHTGRRSYLKPQMNRIAGGSPVETPVKNDAVGLVIRTVRTVIISNGIQRTVCICQQVRKRRDRIRVSEPRNGIQNDSRAVKRIRPRNLLRHRSKQLRSQLFIRFRNPVCQSFYSREIRRSRDMRFC